MRALACGVLMAICVGTTGCGQEVSAGGGAASSPVGTWAFDADGFVDENWEGLLKKAEPGIAKIREGRARMDAMSAGERETAEASLRGRLSERDLAIYEATLEGPAAIKEWAKTQLREQVGNTLFALVFTADGACSVSFTAGGQSREAQGTWTRDGANLTLRMTVVEGRPATARDSEPKTVTMRNGRIYMEFGKGAPTLVARRS
jgi:hypothetical protein